MTDLTLFNDPQALQQELLRHRIALLLPEIIRRTLTPNELAYDSFNDAPGNPLDLFVDVMAWLQAPSHVILESLHYYFDVYTAPESFVTYMASWFHLEPLWIDENQAQRSAALLPAFPTGEGRLRQLLAAICDLTQWRGTAQGLTRFLEIATGIEGFVIEELVKGPDGNIVPFEIHVRIPAAAQPYRGLIERIVRTERPISVTYKLIDEPAPATLLSPPDS